MLINQNQIPNFGGGGGGLAKPKLQKKASTHFWNEGMKKEELPL